MLLLFFWSGVPDATTPSRSMNTFTWSGFQKVGGFIDPFGGYDVADGTLRGKPA
jgi:hypothetical protein